MPSATQRDPSRDPRAVFVVWFAESNREALFFPWNHDLLDDQEKEEGQDEDRERAENPCRSNEREMTSQVERMPRPGIGPLHYESRRMCVGIRSALSIFPERERPGGLESNTDGYG